MNRSRGAVTGIYVRPDGEWNHELAGMGHAIFSDSRRSVRTAPWVESTGLGWRVVTHIAARVYLSAFLGLSRRSSAALFAARRVLGPEEPVGVAPANQQPVGPDVSFRVRRLPSPLLEVRIHPVAGSLTSNVRSSLHRRRASAAARRACREQARVKALTGCDPITARFLHGEFFTFEPLR